MYGFCGCTAVGEVAVLEMGLSAELNSAVTNIVTGMSYLYGVNMSSFPSLKLVKPCPFTCHSY